MTTCAKSMIPIVPFLCRIPQSYSHAVFHWDELGSMKTRLFIESVFFEHTVWIVSNSCQQFSKAWNPVKLSTSPFGVVNLDWGQFLTRMRQLYNNIFTVFNGALDADAAYECCP